MGIKMQIKLSRNVAACKLQSLSEPCPNLDTQSEMEMEDTTCGAVDVYDSDDEFKIVKQKMEEEKNTGEDVEKTVAKSYKYTDPGPTGTTSAKTGQLLVTLLVLLCLPYAAGKSFDYGKQGLQDYCGNFHLLLRNVTGPFSLWSMCEIRQRNTQCPMPYIGRCFPLIENNTEFRFTCIINSTSLSILLKDDQCILITKTKGSNDFLAQCYEKDDCLPGKITSPKPATTNIPHVTFASTNDPSTPNATDPISDSLKKKPRNGFNWTTFIIVLVVAVVCLAIVVFVYFIVSLCIGRFLIRHHIYDLVRSS